MITRRDLVKALERADLAEWVVVEREQELAVVDRDVEREEHRMRWQLAVHADTPGGRGSARAVIDANDGDAEQLVEAAVERARLAVGPAWTAVPQAAPARVELADPVLARGTVIAAALAIAAALPRRTGAMIDARVTLLRERVAIQSRTGFHTEWRATLAHLEATVAAGGHSLEVWREARRAEALELGPAIDDAIRDVSLLASAGPPVPGGCAVVLAADALLHRGLGVWDAFTAQANATIARQGLTRYHERAPVAAGADQVAEPLSITSSGALPFGVRSAPVGDDGDAVRTFPLVTDGIASGLGLDPREAAIGHRDPNGGVRNLAVTLGTWDETTTGRAIEVRRLRGLEIDRYTGDGELEILLAIDRATGKPFAGGTLRLDLVAALAHARRSSRELRRGPYVGPAAVLIERAELV